MAARKRVSASGKSSATPAFIRKSESVAGKKVEEGEKGVGLPADADNTVCVALNRPYGLYFRMPDGRKVELNGNGCSLIGKDKGILPVGTYGLTIIKAEDWEYILKTYGGMRLFRNGLCFATDNREDTQEEAKDRNDLRNGLEPVNPERTQTKEAVGD